MRRIRANFAMRAAAVVATVLGLFLLCGIVAGRAQTRVALVVGNSDYRHAAALPNPLNDASDIASALGRLGFSVMRVENAGFDGMRRALLDFGRHARGSEMAVIFFAGHGMEVGGENWLIPVDAELRSDIDAENEAIGLKSVILTVSGASKLGLVMLDACRNNPFAARIQRTVRTRAVDRGLARVEPTGSVLVAYAARDGTTADDGPTRNSPFTAALLRHIETPGLEINFLFRRVRDDVLAATRRGQEPYTYGALSGEAIFLKTAASTLPSAGVPAAPSPMPPPPLQPVITAPNEPLPADLPINPEVRRLVETHPFFANAPPVKVSAYTIVTNMRSVTTGAGSMTADYNDDTTSRWLRAGLVQLNTVSRWTVNNSGAIGRYSSRSTSVSAANGFFNLSYKVVAPIGRNTMTTTSQLLRIENMRGRIFPVALGNRFSYETIFQWKSTTAPTSQTTAKNACEVTKRYEARNFHSDLTGYAYLLTCDTETAEKNKAPNNSRSLVVFLDDLGVWLRVDPVLIREQIVVNNETTVSGNYTTVSNGTYTLKSFALAR